MRTVILCLTLFLCAPALVEGQWSQDAFRAESPGNGRGPFPADSSESPDANAELARKLGRRLNPVVGGALMGAGLGAVAFGGVELFVDHSNHEDDLIVAGVLMLIGAASGAVVGLLVPR
jgi:hypothetical protein